MKGYEVWDMLSNTSFLKKERKDRDENRKNLKELKQV